MRTQKTREHHNTWSPETKTPRSKRLNGRMDFTRPNLFERFLFSDIQKNESHLTLTIAKELQGSLATKGAELKSW